MLREADLDAVSIVTPDAFHFPLTLQAIKAGKHLLCEKPLALNYKDAKAMATAAKRKGIINMVNFSYRDAPAIHKAHQLIAEGKLGRIMHVEAQYLQSWLASDVWGNALTEPGWLWRLSSKHGSKGTLGDVGVHILDFATYPVGPVKKLNCKMTNFKKNEKNRVGEYKFDVNDSVLIQAEFANGAMGSITATRWATGHENTLTLEIFGNEGAINIDLDESTNTLQACLGDARHKAKWKTIKCPKVPTIYQRFAKSIKTGIQDQPDFDRGAEIQKLLDRCEESDKQGKTLSTRS